MAEPEEDYSEEKDAEEAADVDYDADTQPKWRYELMMFCINLNFYLSSDNSDSKSLILQMMMTGQDSHVNPLLMQQLLANNNDGKPLF